MMRRSSILGLFVCLALWTGCSRKTPSAGGNATSAYSEDSAMAHFLVEPDRALTLLDSAARVGNLTPQRAEYLKATVLLSAKSEADSCIHISQRLIDAEAWEALPEGDDATSFQVDLYRLMTNAAHSVGNQMGVVRYAREGVKLAHGVDKLRGDEADMLGRMGLVLYQMGQHDEGMDALQRARELSLEENDWSSLVSNLNIAKKIYHACMMTHENVKAKAAIHEALTRLDGLHSDIGQVKYAPEAMVADSMALEEFVQFYRASFHSYLANIYTDEQQMDSATYWLDRLASNPMANDPSITQALVRPLIALGHCDEAREHIAALKDLLQGDTLSEDYVRLQQQAFELALKDNPDKRLSEQAAHLFGLMEQAWEHNMQVQLADATAQYQLQDERQRRIDAEDRLQISIIALVTLLCLLIGVASHLYIRRLRAKHQALNVQLDETRKELETIKETKAEEAARAQEMAPEDIYARALDIMERERPFRNPSFDINTLAMQVQTNRYYLSSAINTLAGMNFRSWVAKYRIEYAKTVLRQNPSITNEQLADECGFDNRISLYRNFKNLEGMTPSEWVQQEKCPS